MTAVSLKTQSGTTAKASVHGNAYIIETDEPLAVGGPTLSREAK